jgi:hypothetical protein
MIVEQSPFHISHCSSNSEPTVDSLQVDNDFSFQVGNEVFCNFILCHIAFI